MILFRMILFRSLFLEPKLYAFATIEEGFFYIHDDDDDVGDDKDDISCCESRRL